MRFINTITINREPAAVFAYLTSSRMFRAGTTR
jgi:hypothetical protein